VRVKAPSRASSAPRKQTITQRLASAIPRGSFSTAGAALGGLLGGPAGSAFGSSAGDVIARLTGFGDYVIHENTLLEKPDNQTVPTFMSTSEGMRIKHREFIADITGSSDFTTQSFQSVNPLNATLFPWLSQLASNFEAYRFDGLLFEFRSTSEFSTTNPALGTVVMACQYDVTKPAFAAKQPMEAYEFSTSVKPNECAMVPVECKPGTGSMGSGCLLVGPQQTTSNPQFYNKCTFQLATQGQPTAYTVGELWVTYDVVFQLPRVGTPSTKGVASMFLDIPASNASIMQPVFPNVVTQKPTPSYYSGTEGALNATYVNRLMDQTINFSVSIIPDVVIGFDQCTPGTYLVSCMQVAPSGSNFSTNPTFLAIRNCDLTHGNYLDNVSVAGGSNNQVGFGMFATGTQTGLLGYAGQPNCGFVFSQAVFNVTSSSNVVFDVITAVNPGVNAATIRVCYLGPLTGNGV